MASEREKVIAGLTSSSAICSEGKLAEKAYDAGYKDGIEEAEKVVNDFEPPTWCAVCEGRPEECGCNPDVRTRFMQHIAAAIRALAEGEKP